ncbi:glycosyltransferase family 4 protein [Chroococcidiopsis thermalis]|uniref:Glycosyl transferase group 1 n=1 Tax=Chroococcidiopsis thermalis (strain PCC 7203) TaxID=251229 RepID=K9TYZ9_CHRTP|nr:glycosyltransferase family 1 protein [Chroococcidiopsis thermalis]AFY87780.1 glycosyl transferase group 1 [Chroococcidiopsis thermalis PCC 7203]
MKVFYDISVLGLGQYNPLARTGVARVVENVAYGLAYASECDLVFCESLSFQILKACLEYLNSNLKLKKIPFSHSSFATIFYSKLIELNAMLALTSKVPTKDIAQLENNNLVNDLKHHLEIATEIIENYPYSLNPLFLGESDIFHATFYPIPERIRQVKNITKFLTVYDLIPILYPHFFKGEYESRRNTNTINSLSSEDWAICISEATKNDLCNYSKQIDPSRVFVAHLAADSNMFYPCHNSKKISEVRKTYKIPEGFYLLGLSTLEPRKNIDHIIRAFARVIQETNIKDLFLVLVGNQGWNYEKILEELSNQSLLRNRIILTGRVEDEDLAALYSGAIAFVYPSFYEGFGLPPLEAMQCGIPVITSNTSSLPEVMGDAGIMLDPKDIDGLCHSILEIYNSPSLRAAMSLQSLKQAKEFSWNKCTRETIAAYKTALSLNR